MKQLSAAQTTFLKAYLSKKISSASSLIEETLRLIESKGASNDPQLTSIRSNLAALKVHELEVGFCQNVPSDSRLAQADPRKAEDIVKSELALLRGSLDAVSPPPPPPGGSASPADQERLSNLEAENKRLREQLEDTKGQLGTADAGRRAAEEAKDAWAKEKSALNALVHQREEALQQSETDLATRTHELSEAQAKLKALGDASEAKQSAELAAVRSELEQSRAELSKLRAAHDAAAAQVKALEGRLVSEKEELMEAVAQEVEQVEKAKAEEMAALRAELERLRAVLAASQSQTGSIAQALAGLDKSALALAAQNKQLLTSTQKELNEMRVQLTTGFKGEFVKRLTLAHRDFKALREKYLKEMIERRRLHNIVAELKGNIRVYMRARPPTKKELDQFGSDAICVSFNDLAAGEVRVFNSEKGRDKTWEFDEVFGFDATQEQVYKEVSSLVVSVLDGYNGKYGCGSVRVFHVSPVCIFAYGQTGSGKTYTMSGPPDDFGVNTRALEDLFQRISERSGEFRDSVQVSLLEVYNEEIRDLLVDIRGQGKLEVKQGEFGNYVPGLTTISVTNLSEVIELFSLGDKNRASVR